MRITPETKVIAIDDMQNFNTTYLSGQIEQTQVKTGWYTGHYILNPNSGNSPMPDAGKAGYIFVYFYQDANKRIYCVLYQRSLLPHQPSLMEKHGPYNNGNLTLKPTGWGCVNGNTHCEFYLPEAEILPGAYIRSKPGNSADIYCLKDHETLYYYHTSWHVDYVDGKIGDILSEGELGELNQYIISSTSQVKLC